MSRSASPPGARNDGFTLIEVMAATTLLIVALMAVAAVIVPISRQREQIEKQGLVLGRARSLIEEIKGVAPETVALAYNGTSYPVAGVDAAGVPVSQTGNNVDGTVLTVAVDSTNPQLITVAITGAWDVVGRTQHLELRTEIYSPKGQGP